MSGSGAAYFFTSLLTSHTLAIVYLATLPSKRQSRNLNDTYFVSR
jgi:hypothetical protein